MPTHCKSTLLRSSPLALNDAAYRKVIDDIVYEVDCQVITIKPGADVDIGTLSRIGYMRTAFLITGTRCQPVCRGVRGSPGGGRRESEQHCVFVPSPINIIR